MRHNFIICLWEPRLHKHYQANVRAVAAGQNTLEGSPTDLLVALAQQVLGMSDMTLVPDDKETLQKPHHGQELGQRDGTIPKQDQASLSQDYANPKTTAFHALCIDT